MAVVQTGGYSGVPVDGKDECVSFPGFGHHLCMAWRQDNAGPQSAEEVRALATIHGVHRDHSENFHAIVSCSWDPILRCEWPLLAVRHRSMHSNVAGCVAHALIPRSHACLVIM